MVTYVVRSSTYVVRTVPCGQCGCVGHWTVWAGSAVVLGIGQCGRAVWLCSGGGQCG